MELKVPEFGQRLAGVTYQVRPGAYAIVINAGGKVATVKTAAGFFLPGGGIEQNETPEMALIREVREECSWDVVIVDKVAEAVQHVHAPDEGYFAKQCIFYRCTIRKNAAVEIDKNHQTFWLDIAEAGERLNHASQSWAVSQAIPRISKV